MSPLGDITERPTTDRIENKLNQAKPKVSELAVVTKTKDLCEYVLTITQKSPKQFRFTLVNRMQNLALDVIEHIYRANEIFVQKTLDAANEQRLVLQHQAITELKLLCYISEIAMRQGCILLKQYEFIAKQATECRQLLGAWINSDKKRFSSQV
jgi:hypothetical protein